MEIRVTHTITADATLLAFLEQLIPARQTPKKEPTWDATVAQTKDGTAVIHQLHLDESTPILGVKDLQERANSFFKRRKSFTMHDLIEGGKLEKESVTGAMYHYLKKDNRFSAEKDDSRRGLSGRRVTIYVPTWVGPDGQLQYAQR